MKISVNDQELFNISDTQKRVICNDIPENELDADLKRRVQWIIQHKYEECFKRLKTEWEPKLIADGATSLPVNPDEFAQLVFQHKDYKCRATRDREII